MSNPTPTNPNPSRPSTTTNPSDVTRPLSPGAKPSPAPFTRPAGVDTAGVDHDRERDARATRSSGERPARQISAAPAASAQDTSSRGAQNPALMRSGSSADILTQEQNRSSSNSTKTRHDANERRIRDQGQDSERATQLRNEHATNVVDPEASAFTRRATPAIQASANRLNGIIGRMGELVGTQPATSVKAGENPDTKAKGEYERLRGLAKLELDFLSSIGKSPSEPIPEPPAEPKLRL